MGMASSIQPELDPAEVSQIRKETIFVNDEIKKAYSGFLKDYPSGQITVENLTNIYRKLFPDGDPKDFVQFVFRTFDENGDGLIDFREFIIALSITRRGSLRNKLEWIFSVYDLDSNGYISRAEMKEVLESMYKMSSKPMGSSGNKNLTPDERVDKIFALMDKNGDENLSLEEFVEGVRKNPSVEALVAFSLNDAHTYF